MNERIDKLIEECTSVYDDLVYDGTDSCMQTTTYFDKEKFAELIIKECAAAVAKANNPLGRNIDKVFEMHFGAK